MRELDRTEFGNITGDVPILGFTGALGSGCTFLARTLCDAHNYKYYCLSDPIHQEAQRRQLGETSGVLQDIGNELRRDNSRDYLVRWALAEADEEWPPVGTQGRARGIVLDGIRNTGEVQRLRQVTNFYLISVHADQQTRKGRLLDKGSFPDEQEFYQADARDAEEKTPHGQQVKQCNYLADVIIINDEAISPDAEARRRQYVHDKLYERFVTLIERLSMGQPVYEYHPTRDEALMTAAYCESKRSSCLKRKVGAVVADERGRVVTAGHNEVAWGTKSCLEDPEYQWCARDVVQERLAEKFHCCPNCGDPVAVKGACSECKEPFDRYLKYCRSCKKDPGVAYECPKCKTKVFDEYLAGSAPETGKLLDLCRALHAEENAILDLSRIGVATPPEAVIYTTTFPCNLCANKIVSAGIREVVYAEPYVTRDAEDLFKHNDVEVRRFEGVKSIAYFRFFE